MFEPGVLVPDRLYWRLDYWMQRRLMPLFDGHTVVSKAIVEDFIPGRSVCFLEGGIRPEAFRDSAEPVDARGPEHPFRAVLAGTLETYNGVELALEALELLPAHGFELVIAGAGPLADVVAARSRVDRRVFFRGLVGFDELLTVYRSADVLLNIRLTKALNTRHFFPSKLMEFLASGTPVITTTTGHVEDEFGNYVYLLRDESPAALAALLQRLAKSDRAERLALGRLARAYMLANKTWEEQGRTVAEYFRRLVSNSASADSGQ